MRTVGKVELISTFTTAVCENWNVSDKYTWDNGGDNYPWTRLSMRITGTIKRHVSHMTTHVFDNSNLPKEIVAIDAWKAIR